jgi:pimeloyl-ACP methyl ester carboxylesterase
MSRQNLTVGDRIITVYDDGPRDGPVILCHHGTPGAGGPLPSWVEDAAARGARFVAYDRPGYGDSTPMPGRTVADAAADSAGIMDALGVERFTTWGISGGGPHALACAALLPDRVAAVASLAGVAPFDAPGLNYFRGMGAGNLVEFGLTMAGREHLEPYATEEAGQMLGATPEQITEVMSSLVSPPDREVLTGAIGEYMASILPATFANGVGGWVDDDFAFLRPFGFELDAITVPTLVVHGEQDRFVPVAHGEWLAAVIPGAEARISADEGHLTLMVNRVSDVHEWLLAQR